jgi:hypothetical protein
MSTIKSFQDNNFIQENMSTLQQVIQIKFPLIPCKRSWTGCSTIEIYKIKEKNEFYVGIELTPHDIRKYYTFPLDTKHWTLQAVLDYMYQTPEYIVFKEQGYEFNFEATDEYTTDQILTMLLDEIPLSQGIIHYRNTNKKTVDTHKWFAHQFNKDANMVHMCFSRYGIFYKNTHYVFSGTKAYLQAAFDKLQQEVDEDKAEPYFGRGDHDALLDTPLETIPPCDCHDTNLQQIDHYICSHWELHAFATQEKLGVHTEKIIKKEYNINGFRDEIICI